MKRPHHSTALRGSTVSSAPQLNASSEKPHIRYAAGRLILDQAGERFIGFRTQYAFVYAEPDVANRYAVCANDPRFRFTQD